jgi:hypothetical protein
MQQQTHYVEEVIWMKDTDIVGKKACKNKGFFSGLIGIVQLNDNDFSKYVIVYKDGTRNCFNSLDEITIFENI